MKYFIKPWAHQLKAINQAKDLLGFALFFEQGCGKTSTLINILRHKFEKAERPLSTLVLCPSIVVENWRREFEAHAGLSGFLVTTLTGTRAERLRSLKRDQALSSQKGIAVTNYESLYMDPLFEALLKWKPEVVVLDESHKCKDATAKRTKRAIKLGYAALHKYILSGTPILNSAEDIFAQFLFLDNGETFGEKFFDFRNQYFEDRNRNRPRHAYYPDWRVKPGALAEINRKIYTKAMRVVKSECLDLPPLVRQVVEFKLEGEQGRHYREMKYAAVIEFHKKEVSADLAITKALRLQQITTGFVSADDGTVEKYTPNPRIQALAEVLQSIEPSHKIIIWAVFKQNYIDIAELLDKLGIGYVMVTGETPAYSKQINIDWFNNSASPARVLIGHPAACGTGANLTVADYSIFYSRAFSLEYDLQAEARNHRGGSEVHQKITRIDLVATDSIDEVVMVALREKLNLSEVILKYMVRGRRK